MASYIMLVLMAIVLISILFSARRYLKKACTSTEKHPNKPKKADVYSEINTAYSTYRLVLWLLDDGLKLNDDGSTEWIKRSTKKIGKYSVIPHDVFQELCEESGVLYKSSRYQIWDKKSDIHTLCGRTYSSQEWMERYPWISEEGAIPIISAGIINGIFLCELGALKRFWEENGAVFEPGISDEQLLYEIEMFENRLNEQKKAGG